MKDYTCSYAGGASRRERAAPTRSQRFLREVLTCGGALLAFCGAAPVHALSGFPDTGDIGFFSDPDHPNDTKFYCDWRFAGASPPLAACAQHGPGLVAVQVGKDFDLGLESDVTISSTTFGATTTSTMELSTARVALICETAGDGSGLERCLRITEDPKDGGDNTNSCKGNPKFFGITRSSTQCDADLVTLQEAFGAARIDFTKDRNDDGTLNVNLCTPASWVCGDPKDPQSILTGLGNSEIQQLGSAFVNTPLTCVVGGRVYNYPNPPVKKCP